MKNKGYFIIEALISIIIFSMLILSLFSMVSFLQRRTVRTTFDSEASLLMQEGIEIAHTVLLANWNKYSDGIYSPAFDSDRQNWILVPDEETGLQALYTRKIEIKHICRRPSDGERIDISGACTGIEDGNSKELITTIEWEDKGVAKSVTAKLLVLKLPE